MDGDAAEGATAIALVARRNNSLSSGSRFVVLGSLAAVVLAISLGFALEVQFGMFLNEEQLAATARRLEEHLNIRQ